MEMTTDSGKFHKSCKVLCSTENKQVQDVDPIPVLYLKLMCYCFMKSSV